MIGIENCKLKIEKSERAMAAMIIRSFNFQFSIFNSGISLNSHSREARS